MTRIVVGLSGGVDSSVAAALLVEAGHEVIGVTLRTTPWAEPADGPARFGACCSPATAGVARAVARQLGIRYYLLNHEREFAHRVIADFTREYRDGRTPSPCVVCNREVKFGTLLGRALAWEAEAVATGHYARITRDPASGRLLLREGRDRAKDQSYFLWPLDQAQLARAVFPVGGLTKAEVRAKAHALGLPTAEAPESQELCFVPGDYRAFLRARVPEAFVPGPILDEQGRRLGQHAGLGAYTVGQRRGLGIAEGKPRYVLRLDAKQNTVVVGPRASLGVGSVRARDVNWIAHEPPAEPLRVEVRMRHGASRVPAVVTPVGPGGVEVRFVTAQDAVSPGQSVVFYRGDLVVGGGIIVDAYTDAP
ncbi:MAG TPA: tRNA 2-thiouridine(34) synthase MnmA [Methylomirabilota bacterium]|nr:tRNA 2-thiouridine(34) synthase MnmA [Methylomirabilota bacterium]